MPPKPNKRNPKQIVSKATQKKPKTQGRPARAKPAPKYKQPESEEPMFEDEATLLGSNPPAKQGKCGAKLVKVNSVTGKKNPKGATCKLSAGWGTDHPGYGHCKFHMGLTKNHSMAAAKQQVADRMRTYGSPLKIGPHEALVMEVMRTAGHVKWLGDIIAGKEATDLVQFTLKEGMTISAWVSMYQEERKMLVSVCRVAISAGVAERRVKIAEEQGKQLATALLAFINHPALNLTPQQLVDARPLIGEILRGLDTPDQAMLPVGNNPDQDIVLEAEEITA